MLTLDDLSCARGDRVLFSGAKLTLKLSTNKKRTKNCQVLKGTLATTAMQRAKTCSHSALVCGRANRLSDDRLTNIRIALLPTRIFD